jgi:hypothetical protein
MKNLINRNHYVEISCGLFLSPPIRSRIHWPKPEDFSAGSEEVTVDIIKCYISWLFGLNVCSNLPYLFKSQIFPIFPIYLGEQGIENKYS